MTPFDRAWALLKVLDPTDPAYGEMMAKNMLIDAWNLDFNENDPEGQQSLHDNIHAKSTEEFHEMLHSNADDSRRGCAGNPCTCEIYASNPVDIKQEHYPESFYEGKCAWDNPTNSVHRGHQRNMFILDNWNKWKEDPSHPWPQLGGYREE